MFKYLLPLCIAIPLSVKSQNIFQITYGDNLMGELVQAGQSDLFQFEGEAGDRIWIRVVDAGSAMDASLHLTKTDVVDQTIEGTGGDVEIFDFALPESGVYDLMIYDKHGNDEGSYGVSLHKLNSPEYATQIQCGDDIVGEISTQVGVQVYQFEVQPGDIAFAQMRASSKHFESTFYLINEVGDLLKTSKRRSNAYASISDINITTSEKYSIFVFDANGNDISTFGLTYQDLNDPTCGTQILNCTDHVQANISTLAATHAYEIQLDEGQGFVAKAMSPNQSFESVVDVYNPQGQQLFHQRVSGKASDVVIPKVTMAGSYLLLYNDERANDLGEYYLSYNLLDPACAQELPSCRTMEGYLDHKTDINLYYFMMPEQMNGLKIKEIDKVIEPFGVIVNDGDYTILKGSVKLEFDPPKANPGDIIYLALSDNAGNDLGQYKVDFEQNSLDEPSLSAPVAICRQDLSFTIPSSGYLELTSADIDGGSYDDCQIVQMNLAPNNFDCTSVGDQEVVLEVVDNDGLTSSCTATINIMSDLALVLDECMKIAVENYDPKACIDILASATGGSGEYEYVWSNGATTPLSTVCPEDASNLYCEVYDGNGCSVMKDLWLPMGVNILCHSNGKKVSICHIPPGNPEDKMTLCINVNSAKAHFGHSDYMGPCDGAGCGEESEISLTKRENGHLTISGLVATQGDFIRVDLQDQMPVQNTKIDLTLVDALGRTFHRETAVATSIEYLELQLPSSGLSPGMYYLLLRCLDGSSKQLTAPILIK